MLNEFPHSLERRLRFAWHLERLIAGSARPGRYGDVDQELAWLHQQGVETVVNLCCDPFIPPSSFADKFDYVHLPVVDGHPPSIEQLDQALLLARNSVEQGRAILFHCRGGVGRTATILTPALMEHGGLTLDEAVAELRRAGRLTQSMEQWRFIERWADRRNIVAE